MREPRKCPVCLETFKPRVDKQAVCGIECAIEQGRQKRARQQLKVLGVKSVTEGLRL